MHRDGTWAAARVGLRIDDQPAAPSFNRPVVERPVVERHDETRAADILSLLRGYLIDQRFPGACAPGYFLTPLCGWDGTPR